MRTTLLIATIVAGLALAACSSGGSQAVPGGSQAAAPMNQHQPYHIIFLGHRYHPAQSCGAQYYMCYNVAYGLETLYNICVGIGNNCLKQEWSWSQTMYTVLNHHITYRVYASISPNPGNPTTVTLIERFPLYPDRPPSSHIGVKYDQHIIACHASQCVSANVGIVPIGGGQ